VQGRRSWREKMLFVQHRDLTDCLVDRRRRERLTARGRCIRICGRSRQNRVYRKSYRQVRILRRSMPITHHVHSARILSCPPAKPCGEISGAGDESTQEKAVGWTLQAGHSELPVRDCARLVDNLHAATAHQQTEDALQCKRGERSIATSRGNESEPRASVISQNNTKSSRFRKLYHELRISGDWRSSRSEIMLRWGNCYGT